MPKGKIKRDDLIKEFMNLDADGDGDISIEELGNVLRSMKDRLKVTEEEIQEVLKVVDKDGDGSINLKEFHDSMKDPKGRKMIRRALVHRSVSGRPPVGVQEAAVRALQPGAQKFG